MVRCLIVDSSSVIRKVASRILSGSGMTVQEAATGSDALIFCATHAPNVIVLDARLPDMPADALIRQIFALNIFAKPQIHLCTTELDIGTIMRAKRAGATGYILKPFNRTQLLESFRNMNLAA